MAEAVEESLVPVVDAFHGGGGEGVWAGRVGSAGRGRGGAAVAVVGGVRAEVAEVAEGHGGFW